MLTSSGFVNGLEPTIHAATEAIVAFEDRRDARSLRLLRPGFRHCFCLLGQAGGWALCDPLKSQVALSLVSGLDAAALAGHLAAAGRTVLLGTVDVPAGRGAGLRPLSCVEIVKRLIGVDAPMVFTPFQLYRRLLEAGPDGARFEKPRQQPTTAAMGLDLAQKYE